MNISSFSLFEQSLLSPIVKDYLRGHAALNHLHNGIPSLGALEQSIHRRQNSVVNREALAEALNNQHESIKSDVLSKNINALKEEFTFTITTGHQLCLATGPLYFIYKIASAIKLSRRLKLEFPQYNFIPIYWMASEDHDFEEINHAVLFNKIITWNTQQQGAVGRFNLNGFEAFIEELSTVLGNSEKANQALLLRAILSNEMAQKESLSAFIKNLVREEWKRLFSMYENIHKEIEKEEKKKGATRKQHLCFVRSLYC